MTYTVGPKGQVVISKEIRDKLGIQPGWLALQRLVDGHVELYFVPPEHDGSLAGSLAKYTNVTVGPGEEWTRAREHAWAEGARDKEQHLSEKR
jgi:AbrB family looped-hinge helix DNA binding protein